MLKPKKCNIKSKTMGYMVSSAGCPDDDAAVSALPDQWVPQHGGATLSNYLKELEMRHKKAMRDIVSAAQAANTPINNKIRVLSEDLIDHIEQTSIDMECLVEKNNPGCSSLSKDARDETLKSIFELNSKSIDDITRFMLEASVLERERADSLRTLLYDQFQNLIKIGHLTPKDLLHEFDQRAYEINQQLLSNCRAYKELENQLRIQADDNVVRTRSLINQLSLGVGISERGRSALPWEHKEQSIKRRSTSAIADDRRGASDPFVSNMLDAKEGDECVLRLVQEYKATVLRLFTDFAGKLNDLEKDLGSNPLLVGDNKSAGHIAYFQETLTETINNLSNITYKNLMASRDMVESTGNYLIAIQKSLGDMGQILQDTYKILHDAGHLWDNHMLRQALAQKLTIAAVEDLISSNDASELANEVTFNIALEELRRSPSIELLEIKYENVVNLLESTAEVYRVHSEAELNRLEEFMDLPTPLEKTLLSEIGCFLENNPRNNIYTGIPPRIDVGDSVSGATDFDLILTDISGAGDSTDPFSRAILETEIQQRALNNWRNGFLESLATNNMLVPEKLQSQIQMWVNERSASLQMRFSLKMNSHSIRIERAKAAQGARLAELQNHQTRLAAHLRAMQDFMSIIPLEIAEFGSIDSRDLYPFRQWIERMQVDIDALLLRDPLDPELKRLKMMSYDSRLTRHRQLFEKSLNAAFESYKLQLMNRIQNVRISNVSYMSSITLTRDGGRFEANEATKVSNSLVTAANALETFGNTAAAAVIARQKTILDQADNLMVNLRSIVGDSKKKDVKKSTPDNKRASSKPQLENVQLLDKYNLRNPSKGTLYFATTHLIFVDHEMRKETWILLTHISSVDRLPITTTGSPLLVRTKTFQSVFFVIPRERDCHEMHQTLLRLSQPVHIDELYCFHYKATPDDLPKSAGWNFFDIQTEYQRMNVPNDQWVLCTANKDYELCDTYPSEIYVPARASTAVLLGSASFRSRGRLPALAYLHHNKAAITRCAQPLSGFSARCMEDEQMLDLIRRANPNCGYMYVVDTRPRINAMVNRAAGKGYENEAFYENIKFQFMGIGNIHVMRKSLQKLVETCEQNSPTMSSFLSGLESSGWLKHIKSIMDTSWWIANAISHGVSVCVHCSDGWDRTAQACSLAALALEPHYRTINGYQALIEKDWLSFGHKFTARCGHIACLGRERSPVFTQLLDCTWQLLRMHPEAFQFNERFLLTLHDHVHACQYGTFVGNCQKDRRDLRLSERTFSLWGYMASHLNEYKNPLYDPKAHPDLLRPDLTAQNIRFWRGMYCRHESGVHPREPLGDMLPACVEHCSALQHHLNYLSKRITTFKGLLSGRRPERGAVVNYQNQNGTRTSIDIDAKMDALHLDNKLLYEGSASELECANDSHPLKEAAPPKVQDIPLITEKVSEVVPASLPLLEVEVNSVALEWKSLKNVTECTCSTPLDHFSRKHHCWGCGRVVCTRCVTSRAALPALASPHPAPLCAACDSNHNEGGSVFRAVFGQRNGGINK